MKRTIVLVAAAVPVAVFLACGRDPIGRTGAPRLTLSVDSVVVDAGTSALVTATVSGGDETAQFTSRDPGVATVDAAGTIRGVAIGSTYVVATLASRAEVRDSVRVRVLPPGSTPAAGQWGLRAPLLVPNSELAFAEWNGRLYLLGGYPASRQTSTTVQVYDVAGDRWEMGPPLPQPNNHGMAAAVNGRIYLIGGQSSDVSDQGYLDTVHELNPATGVWTTRAPMPTARGAGVAVVLDGRIYVAGGRPPRGRDFAVYDPAADRWEVLPELPSQRNHLTGAAMDGRIHVIGGRLGHGLSPDMTAVHEVYDPRTRTWTTAAPMPRARSGMNGVMARGCFHVWGGEGPNGMFADHDYYDPRTNQWSALPGMSLPVHGVYGSAYVAGLIWAAGGGTDIGGIHGSLHTQVYRPAVSCE